MSADPSSETASRTANPADPAVTSGPSIVVRVVPIDRIDSASLLSAVHRVGCSIAGDVSLTVSLDSLGRELSRTAADADLFVVLGGAERVLQLGWVERLAALPFGPPVVAAIADVTVEHASRAVNAGARGLIVLPATPERVERSLRAILAATSRERDARSRARTPRAALTQLTDAERDVLKALLDGFANKQIAQRLSIGLRTVELRRSKIMKKMAARSLAQLVRLVAQAGAGGPCAVDGSRNAG